MSEAVIPNEVAISLRDQKYARPDPDIVVDALHRLGVPPHSLLQAFFRKYEGPFWSEHLGYELLDVSEGVETVESATETCQQKFGFPRSAVVLTQLTSGQVAVLNTEIDKVYEVDFEGGDVMLKTGELVPRWGTFRDFLLEYFAGG